MTALLDGVSISLDQGADYASLMYTWQSGTPSTAVSLVGYTARLMLRVQYSDITPILSLTQNASSNGQIMLGGTAGTVSFQITSAATTAMAATYSSVTSPNLVTGVWDLFLDGASSTHVKFLSGNWSLRAVATR